MHGGGGTPGTWLQILPAFLAADPASGTLPTGYLIVNVTQGTLKRHAGGFVWEIVIGGSASQKIGFWGAAPVAQPSGSGQAAVALGNTDGEIGSLMISDPPTQDEELADDLRNLSTLIHSLRTALVGVGYWGGA